MSNSNTKTFVTDCDYCGQISLCFNDTAGGTCCCDCGDRETGEVSTFGVEDETWEDVYGGFPEVAPEGATQSLNIPKFS